MLRSALILSAAVFSLGACYEFETQPFAEKDLMRISATPFGREILKTVAKINPGTAKKLKDSPFSDLNSKQKVFVVDDKTVILQNTSKDDKNYSLSIFMKTDSHLMACTFNEEKSLKIPKSIKIKEKEKSMFPTYMVKGSQRDLQKLVINMMDTVTKICLGIPFK